MFFSFSKQLVFFPPLFTTMTSSARAEGLCPTNPWARHFRYSSGQIWARYKRLWCRRWHTFVIPFKSGQCSWSVRKKKTISGNVASSNSSSPDFIQHVVRCRNSSALQGANYIRKRTDFGFFFVQSTFGISVVSCGTRWLSHSDRTHPLPQTHESDLRRQTSAWKRSNCKEKQSKTWQQERCKLTHGGAMKRCAAPLSEQPDRPVSKPPAPPTESVLTRPCWPNNSLAWSAWRYWNACRYLDSLLDPETSFIHRGF